jgi:hypothetical protein
MKQPGTSGPPLGRSPNTKYNARMRDGTTRILPEWSPTRTGVPTTGVEDDSLKSEAAPLDLVAHALLVRRREQPSQRTGRRLIEQSPTVHWPFGDRHVIGLPVNALQKVATLGRIRAGRAACWGAGKVWKDGPNARLLDVEGLLPAPFA